MFAGSMSAVHPAAEPPASHEAARFDALRARLVAAAVLIVVGLLNAVGLLLVVRRLFGAFTADLPLWPLFVTALVATVAAKTARIAWRAWDRPLSADGPGQRALDGVVGWGSSAGLLLLALGCCYPGYRNSEWVIWLPMLIADQFWRQNFFDNGCPGGGDVSMAPPVVSSIHASDALSAERELVEQAFEAAPVESTASDGELLLQQLFRVRDADGYEVVYGTVRADFLAGQRHATVHIGICPPLESAPQVEAEVCAWPDARVKVTQALPHGVRLDVRLSEPAEEPCLVPIDMAASPRTREAA